MASSLCKKCKGLFNIEYYEVRSSGQTAFRQPNSFTDWYFACDIDASHRGPPAPKESLGRIVGFALNNESAAAAIVEDGQPEFNWVPEDVSIRKLQQHHTKNELAASADKGCELCEVLLSDVKVDNIGNGEEDDADEEIQSIVLFSSQYDPKIKRLGRTSGLKDFGCLTMHLLYLGKDYSVLRALYSSKVWDNYRDAGRRNTGRSLDVEIDQSLKCQTWLIECLQEHTECEVALTEGPSKERVYPARLLKLSKNDDVTVVKLVNTSAPEFTEKEQLYATLSHRWSDTVGMRLLKVNVEEFQNGIHFSELPRTFQDVVDVVLTLGIKYLWIDALCIIQDSEKDFASEAPRMAAIYSGCLINIAATSSSSSNAGLFNQIQHPAWKAIRSQDAVFNIATHYPLLDFRSMVNLAPLNRRGWVFQERVLAPRKLHFAADKLWWDCRERVDHEDGSYENKGKTDDAKPLFLIEGGYWTSLVQQYSRGDLTRESDRLIAFAGIAETYCSVHEYKPDDYLAGLWRPHLREHLLWYIMDLKAIRRLGKRGNEPYVVDPSWSWASVNAQPTFVWLSENYSCTWHPNFTIIDATVVLQGGSPFGNVSSGKLEVECFLHPASGAIEESHENSLVMQVSGCTYRYFDTGITRELQKQIEVAQESEQAESMTTFKIYIDKGTSATDIKSMSAFFVPVLRRESKEKPGYFRDQIWGLILQKVESEPDGKTFQRIGLWSVYCLIGFPDLPSWWSQGDSLERIVIV